MSLNIIICACRLYSQDLYKVSQSCDITMILQSAQKQTLDNNQYLYNEPPINVMDKNRKLLIPGKHSLQSSAQLQKSVWHLEDSEEAQKLRYGPSPFSLICSLLLKDLRLIFIPCKCLGAKWNKA